MANVVVTGGFGFIGSNWIHKNYKENNILIVDNHSIGSNPQNVAIDHPHIGLVSKDICDFKKEDLSASGDFVPDYILHFAAESHVDRSIEDPLGFIKTNVMGTANMLNIARETGARFVHVSTDEVYGHLGVDDDPFTEESKYFPRSPYSASKASSDHIVRSYHETYGTDVVITNCCNNAGPRQFTEKLIPKVISNAMKGEVIPIYGKGDNIREWIHVDDHNEAINQVMLFGKSGETYCIGSGIELTNMQLVNLLLHKLDELFPKDRSYTDLITFVADRAGHDFRYAIDSTKIRDELGWVPKHSLDEIIEDVIKFYTENK